MQVQVDGRHARLVDNHGEIIVVGQDRFPPPLAPAERADSDAKSIAQMKARIKSLGKRLETAYRNAGRPSRREKKKAEWEEVQSKRREAAAKAKAEKDAKDAQDAGGGGRG